MKRKRKDCPVESKAGKKKGRRYIRVLVQKLNEGSRGPIKIILIGDRMVDATDFQATCDFVPRKDSGG